MSEKQNAPQFIEKFRDIDPELFRIASELASTAMAPGALDPKTKALIAMALDAIKGAAQGVAVLAELARKMGASEDEIKEALRLAYYVSGNETLVTALAAFHKA